MQRRPPLRNVFATISSHRPREVGLRSCVCRNNLRNARRSQTQDIVNWHVQDIFSPILSHELILSLWTRAILTVFALRYSRRDLCGILPEGRLRRDLHAPTI